MSILQMSKIVQILTKNQFKELHSSADQSLMSADGYVIEKMAKNAVEVSVIVAVSQKLNSVSYTPCEMVFDPRSNLMDYLISPSRLSDKINDICYVTFAKRLRF